MKKSFSTVIAALALGACNSDPTQTRLAYMPDMADAYNIAPHRGYIDPPQGSVSREFEYFPKDVLESEKLSNPLVGSANSAHHLAEGKRSYETFCVPCHGHGGKGDGPVTDKFPKPPDLTAEASVKRGDGYYVHQMHEGGATMPSYAYALTKLEKMWEIALYIRTLQHQR